MNGLHAGQRNRLPLLAAMALLVCGPGLFSQSTAAPAKDAGAPGSLTILENTLIVVRTMTGLKASQMHDGNLLAFTVTSEASVDDVLAIPRGATVRGVVIRAKKTGKLTGAPEITLKLTSLTLGNRSYPITSYLFRVAGTSKTRPTEVRVLKGAAGGAAIGAVVTAPINGSGAATPAQRAIVSSIGAAAGAGIGTAVSAGSAGPEIWIPAESEIVFSLASPVTITPLSPKEAAKLSEGLHAGGPVLYVRGEQP